MLCGQRSPASTIIADSGLLSRHSAPWVVDLRGDDTAPPPRGWNTASMSAVESAFKAIGYRCAHGLVLPVCCDSNRFLPSAGAVSVLGHFPPLHGQCTPLLGLGRLFLASAAHGRSTSAPLRPDLLCCGLLGLSVLWSLGQGSRTSTGPSPQGCESCGNQAHHRPPHEAFIQCTSTRPHRTRAPSGLGCYQYLVLTPCTTPSPSPESPAYP